MLAVGVTDFLAKYRQLVNDNLLFVSVDVQGSASVTTAAESHPNDVALTGFSDAILRCGA